MINGRKQMKCHAPEQFSDASSSSAVFLQHWLHLEHISPPTDVTRSPRPYPAGTGRETEDFREKMSRVVETR
ncbi:hypothetical protein GWI33_008869 [Rhynchophorus ferrugineus]|uniref:Uncharacterized protein n=1 Tax=Rhynchophorus ferrugineus TaxID=354439 RepID=A0A834IFN7_RHYFE|nr:hypothetical protein GWI33_008869 [Rhynchophorus ferrugineus]